MGRAGHGHLITVGLLQQGVQTGQVGHHLVQAVEMVPFAVDKGLFPKQDVAVPVVGHLVPLVQHPAEQPLVVHRAAPLVLVDVRVVVIPHAAPVRLAAFASCVRIVFTGVPHHVEGALGSILPQRVQEDVGQGLSVKFIGAGGQVHGTIVEGHGHHPLPGLHPFYPPGVAHMVLLLRQELLDNALARLSHFYD